MTLLQKLLFCWCPLSGGIGSLIFAALVITPASLIKGGDYLPHAFVFLAIYGPVAVGLTLLSLFLAK
jgi:hypothetical protein